PEILFAGQRSVRGLTGRQAGVDHATGRWVRAFSPDAQHRDGRSDADQRATDLLRRLRSGVLAGRLADLVPAHAAEPVLRHERRRYGHANDGWPDTAVSRNGQRVA